MYRTYDLAIKYDINHKYYHVSCVACITHAMHTILGGVTSRRRAPIENVISCGSSMGHTSLHACSAASLTKNSVSSYSSRSTRHKHYQSSSPSPMSDYSLMELGSWETRRTFLAKERQSNATNQSTSGSATFFTAWG